MSTIVVAFILIALIVAIVLILVFINNKDKRKHNLELLEQFSNMAVENNLAFSSQELLENGVIGLDGRQKRILIVRRTKHHGFDSVLINLNQVKSCNVKELYRSVHAGAGKRQRNEKRIDKVVLDFELNNGESIQLTFFDPLENHIATMYELQEKTRKWQTILSKLLKPASNGNN